MKFGTKNVRTTAIAAAALGPFAAVPSSAETLNAEGRHQIVVNVDDGVLATPRGVNRLRQEMLRNARRTCRGDARAAAESIKYPACMAEMTELGHRVINTRAEQWAARNSHVVPLALVEKKD